MPASIIRYKKVQDQYTTYTLAEPEWSDVDAPHVTELATLDDGYTYVAVPDSVALSDQPSEITVEPVTLTPELREQIKAKSPHCQLITQLVQEKIRSKYSVEDEQYFARIGVGSALGVYTFEPGEQDELLAFGSYVEAVRQWGRDERAKLGL
jgi:hypothetical protein